MNQPEQTETKYAFCSTCPYRSKCSKFKPIYIQIKAQVDKWYSESVEYIRSEIAGDARQEHAIAQLRYKYADKLQQMLNDREERCVFEKDIALNTWQMLDKQFNLKENAELALIAEEIINAKIKSFRFDLLHVSQGVVKEIQDKRGQTTWQITPGVHYTLEYGKNVADMLQKMHQIKHNTANQNVHLHITDTFAQKLDEWRKQVKEIQTAKPIDVQQITLDDEDDQDEPK